MRSELLEELQEITAFLSERKRVSATPQMREAQAFVRRFLSRHAIPFVEENFEVEKGMPLEARIKVNGAELSAYPFVNSLWGEKG